ncbi:MAG: hypothetical protein II752_05905 [Muribaculaceae bacterium]|nr:hypothetical protein [Muribaculaceae bacterium]
METAAKIMSRVFSPILVPTMAIAVALWGTALVITPDFVKIRVVAMTLLITGAIPAVTIAVLHFFHRVSDATISNPRERTIPFVVAILCYLGEAIYLSGIHAPLWLTNFIVSAAVAIFIVATVNLFWKVSAHTCAVGGLAGLEAWLIASELAVPSMIVFLIITILVVGLVGSARLVRRLHTLSQVVAGALIGFVVVYFLPMALALFH